jgi:ribosomal protein L12E/L44/L45/RPP1/RPP2
LAVFRGNAATVQRKRGKKEKEEEEKEENDRSMNFAWKDASIIGPH